MEEEVQLTFDYIDTKEKLVLPIFFKALIDKPLNNSIEKFINSIYLCYNKKNKAKNKNFLALLSTIKSIKDIPKEILSKYFVRLYTIESDFYGDVNRDLGKNLIEKYIPFIKILYEGVKLEALDLASDEYLYRGTKIANEEIEKIKKFLNNKKMKKNRLYFLNLFYLFQKMRILLKNISRKKMKMEIYQKSSLKCKKIKTLGIIYLHMQI